MKLFNKLSLIALGAIMTVGAAVSGLVNSHETTAVHAASEVTFTADAVVNNFSYQAYFNSDAIITCGGNQKSVGSNSNNRSKCTLSSYSKYAVSPVTTSDTASAFATLNSHNSIGKISYTYSGGKNQTSTNVYVIYSADGNTFSQLTLTNGTTQGGAIATSKTFEFAPVSGYFALLFKATNSSGDWRIDNVTFTLTEVSTEVKKVTGVQVGGSLTKTDYDTSDSWDLSGLTLDVSYDNDTIENIDVSKVDSSTYTLTPAAPSDTSITSFTIEGVYEGFDYSKEITGITVSAINYDKIDRALTGVTSGSQNYVDWTATGTQTGVVYKGQSAGQNDSVQLRSKNNNSGIVSTTSNGANLAKVEVVWQSATLKDRTLNIYGSNTAYTNPTDLYDASTYGTLIGTIVCGTSTELVVTGSYKYVGLRSADSAMYLSEIRITWEEIDTSADEAAAEAFATTFLNETHTVCETTQGAAAGEAPQAMKDVWTTLSAAYGELSATAKDFVKDNAQLITRYNAIMAKYTGLNDFLGTGVTALNNMMMFTSNNANVNVVLLVAIATLVAFGLTVIVIRRRKHNA